MFKISKVNSKYNRNKFAVGNLSYIIIENFEQNAHLKCFTNSTNFTETP